MWTYIFFLLFFVTFVALLVVLNAFTKKVSELERQRAELEVEEDRVFDFLHGLGAVSYTHLTLPTIYSV